MGSTICNRCGGWMYFREVGDNYGVGTEAVCNSCGHTDMVEWVYYDMLDEFNPAYDWDGDVL